MDKRTARKGAATLVALALLVLLALPAQALSAEPAGGAAAQAPGLLPSLWTWITEVATLATDGLAGLWRVTASDPLPDPERGFGLDPDGAPSTQVTSDPLPDPQRGSEFDPNG